MSNDANALKRKEQIKKILVYGGMVMLCLLYTSDAADEL